ncbi:MAG: hypothetical protein AAF211_00280 [Myxococcota bacterium]
MDTFQQSRRMHRFIVAAALGFAFAAGTTSSWFWCVAFATPALVLGWFSEGAAAMMGGAIVTHKETPAYAFVDDDQQVRFARQLADVPPDRRPSAREVTLFGDDGLDRCVRRADTREGR